MKKLIALIAVASIVLLPATLAGDDTGKGKGSCPAQGGGCCKQSQGSCPMSGKSAKAAKKEVKAEKQAAKKAAKKSAGEVK